MTNWHEKHDHIPGFPKHDHPHDHAVHFDMNGLAGEGKNTGWMTIESDAGKTVIRPQCGCPCHETVTYKELDGGCLTCDKSGMHKEGAFRDMFGDAVTETK